MHLAHKRPYGCLYANNDDSSHLAFFAVSCTENIMQSQCSLTFRHIYFSIKFLTVASEHTKKIGKKAITKLELGKRTWRVWLMSLKYVYFFFFLSLPNIKRFALIEQWLQKEKYCTATHVNTFSSRRFGPTESRSVPLCGEDITKSLNEMAWIKVCDNKSSSFHSFLRSLNTNWIWISTQ